MSPFSTFQSCGSSSSRARRRNRPIGVTRGSPSFDAQTGPVAASASCRIDRNLCTVKIAAVLADAPLVIEHRPGRRQLDRRARPAAMTGRPTTRPRPTTTMSIGALARRRARGSSGSPTRRSASSAAGSRRRSCRCTPRRPTPDGRRSRRRASSRAACPSAACRARRPGSPPRGRRRGRGRSTECRRSCR